MVRTIDVHVTAESALGLLPMHVRREDDVFLIGRRGSGAYLALSEDAMRVVDLLQERHSIEEIKRRLQEESPETDVRLHDLIQALATAGLVSDVSGRSLDAPEVRRVPTLPKVRRDQISWLFSPWMAGLYAVVIGLGVVLLWTNPSFLPVPGAVLIQGNYALTSLIGLVMLAVMVAKHEAAHVVAGRYVGVDAYCRISHRLYFPVFEADLTDLWSVGRGERLLAFSAGMVSDLLVGGIVVIALWLQDQGAVAFGAGLSAALELLLLIAVTGVLFQFNVFLRTDVYYMLAAALNCRSLASDARGYLAGLLRRRASPQRQPWFVRVYAIASLVVTTLLVLLGIAYVVSVVSFLWSGHANFGIPPAAAGAGGRLVSAASFLLLIVLIALSISTARRTTRIEFVLRAPQDL